MLFNSLQFAIFAAVVLGLYRFASPARRSTVLLVASLVFYGLWIPSYLLLFLADVVVNYGLLLLVVRSNRPRLYVTISVVFTLGLLAYFKYATFALQTLAPILAVGPDLSASAARILLPLGISFYSFQIIALVVDSYRDRYGPPPTFKQFLLFIAFFPQLIAGPILRGAELIPQLIAGGAMTRSRSRRGALLLAVGLAKKVVFADFLLAPFVDDVFASPGVGPAPFHLVALYGFAFQIYFDFSGYTDMARGIALLLGFELPLNFREPYLSRDPAEFWRRWHMTLSRWLRDYLYIPLGGNRHGSLRTYGNLMTTMLLGGLWHGASWNFVVWGGLHGCLLVLHRSIIGKRESSEGPLRARDVLSVLVMFHLTCLAWVFFRAPTFEQASVFVSVLVSGSYRTAWPFLETCIVVLCVFAHVLERLARTRLKSIHAYLSQQRWGPLAEGAFLGLLVGLAVTVGGSGGEFIYFQF